MSNMRQVLQAATTVAKSQEFENFRINATDFLSARERGDSTATRLEEMVASVDDAAEIVNRSFPRRDERGQFTNVISPVVVPRVRRTFLWAFWVIVLLVGGAIGSVMAEAIDRGLGITNASLTFFGPHYWVLVLAYAAFSAWKNSYVMVPDGCQALITRFGKLEAVVGAGRTLLLDPRKRISYIVNTTREYPYNAPIREAATSSGINASVDLFLQFRIEDPAAFIFTLGGVRGFAEKLQNAISEVTRALIYGQRAENIYDLVGDNTQQLLATLNNQFLPAVRFVNANITHAEPSSQEYRMDLAAPEMLRVAKEAYTYEYELTLRKQQDEGDLAKELAEMHETMSAIRAEIATYQAQSDTARQREIDRANAQSQQLLAEAESAAKEGAALYEAQALDLRAVSAATFPQMLSHRLQQEVLTRLAAIADRMPQVVHAGSGTDEQIDFPAIARRMLGLGDGELLSDEELAAVGERLPEIRQRIQQRREQIRSLVPAGVVATPEGGAA